MCVFYFFKFLLIRLLLFLSGYYRFYQVIIVLLDYYHFYQVTIVLYPNYINPPYLAFS